MIWIILAILGLIAWLWKLSVALWLGTILLFFWWAVWFSNKTDKKQIELPPETPISDLLKHSEPLHYIDKELKPFEKRNVDEAPIRIPVKIVKVVKKYHAKITKPRRKFKHS